MKKVFYPLACLAAGALVACGGQKSGSAQADQPNEVALAYSKSVSYTHLDVYKRQVQPVLSSVLLAISRLLKLWLSWVTKLTERSSL